MSVIKLFLNFLQVVERLVPFLMSLDFFNDLANLTNMMQLFFFLFKGCYSGDSWELWGTPGKFCWAIKLFILIIYLKCLMQQKL